MGISSSKQSSTYKPSAQQLGAANTLTNAYNAAQPTTNAIAGQLAGLVPGQVATMNGTQAGVGAASGYYNDVLGGKYLDAGNPYLNGIISTSNNAIQDRVNGAFSAAGRTGSGANQYALAKALGENENALRYGDYNSQLSRMDSAAQGAGNLNSQQLASLLGLSTTAAGLPLSQANQYAQGIGSLGIGGTTTGSSTPSLVDQAGKALQLGSFIFSDRRLKTDVVCTGVEADGLGRYSYRYLTGERVENGVMADEVAMFRPHALGPRIGGFATVNMEAL